AGPVPASDVVNFYVNASGGATLYVYDVAGRLVFSEEIAEGEFFYAWPLVDKADKPLANGLYLCFMVTADGVKSDTMRLVISR
ncbi:MAG TPA: T9SS type A sorting domain-containing protein, partial [Bacillota bacterium]|nr:T9SS type A sorting domain-containing protein [Bacillota bacterium]